jgi:hypothetical protein
MSHAPLSVFGECGGFAIFASLPCPGFVYGQITTFFCQATKLLKIKRRRFCGKTGIIEQSVGRRSGQKRAAVIEGGEDGLYQNHL